ncbi:MAG: hypothetical protein KDH09_09150, partial [Chrysiogenetes bacterium]|nr:hypothetical protein [Chrysiogenetes bacterium]
IELNENTPERLEVLGGKGCGLVRLIRAGLPVPEAWCLPAGIHAVHGGEMTPALSKELRAFWKELRAKWGAPLVAVRSSATAEDLEEASFAGVYTTVLGVASERAFLEAVETCWGALHEEAARAYREKKGIGHDVGIALVIQRMLRPECSGVLLTANPRRAFANEIVIDAAWGVGEAIVSGKTHPDHLVVERSSGKLREEHLGGKKIEMQVLKGGGLSERPVSAKRRAARCLGDAQLRVLWQLACQVEEKIGPRQDLEWAIEDGVLYLLQQRPITGLPPLHPKNVWTRKFGDEYLADYNFPLGRGLLVKWISDNYLKEICVLQGHHDLVGVEPLRNHEGYSYFNGAFMARMLRAVPKSAREGNTMGWFPPLWEKHIQAQPFEPRRLLGMLSAPTKDPRGPVNKNLAALDRHTANVDRVVVPLLKQDYTKLSESEWKRQFDEVYALGIEHFRVIRWGMGNHNPALHAGLQGLLKRWCGDKSGELYQTVVSGLPETKTALINRDIWRLGIEARGSKKVRKGILAQEPYEKLRKATKSDPFWASFDAFIAKHGHRSSTRELAAERWVETPGLVLGFVRVQLHGESAPPDPDAREEHAIAERRRAEKQALAALGRGPAALAKRAALKRLMELTQQYTRYRENQRYHLDYLLLHIRKLVLEQGRRLVKKKYLKEPGEIFFLEDAEFWQLVGGEKIDRKELRARIEARRAHWLKWKDRLPATYLFDDVETEGEIVEGDPRPGQDSADAAGIGASRGSARGAVRVVRELAHLDEIEPGEILVASNIDPGWTNVFPLLGGLVTETGGILSHGALLAREYGIPAVMGVKNAMGRFETGQVLEIDGGTGAIREGTRDGAGEAL